MNNELYPKFKPPEHILELTNLKTGKHRVLIRAKNYTEACKLFKPVLEKYSNRSRIQWWFSYPEAGQVELLAMTTF